MMFTDYYAENSCTAGRSTFITGQTRAAHRPLQGRHSGRARRAAEGRHHHRAGPEAAGLRDGPVRQEPPRRQGRVPAHQPRLRRVLRQPLPPERRGGAGASVLAEGRPGLPEGDVAARRPPQLRRRQDRGLGAAQPQAHGDDRRRDDGRRHRVHQEAGGGGDAVLHLDELHPHARIHPRACGDTAARAACRATSTRTACWRWTTNVGKFLKPCSTSSRSPTTPS